MTRKDYKLIAKALRDTRPEKHWDPNKVQQWTLTLNYITNALTFDNPKFKPSEFLEAAGALDDH